MRCMRCYVTLLRKNYCRVASHMCILLSDDKQHLAYFLCYTMHEMTYWYGRVCTRKANELNVITYNVNCDDDDRFDVRIKRTNRVHRPKFRTHRRNTSKVARIIARTRMYALTCRVAYVSCRSCT